MNTGRQNQETTIKWRSVRLNIKASVNHIKCNDEKDLWVIFDADFSIYTHIQTSTNQANKYTTNFNFYAVNQDGYIMVNILTSYNKC